MLEMNFSKLICLNQILNALIFVVLKTNRNLKRVKKVLLNQENWKFKKKRRNIKFQKRTLVNGELRSLRIQNNKKKNLLTANKFRKWVLSN